VRFFFAFSGGFECYRDVTPIGIQQYTRTMRTSASIRLKSDRLTIRFEWLDFDGDDCFNTFRIDVVTEATTRRFDFGACGVNGLRKLSRFFRDTTQTTIGGGFRNPDVCYYDLDRKDNGYCLVVRFEDKRQEEEYNIQMPEVEIDDEFMRTVYAGENKP